MQFLSLSAKPIPNFILGSKSEATNASFGIPFGRLRGPLVKYYVATVPG